MVALILAIQHYWKIGVGVLVTLIPILAYAFGRRDASTNAKLERARLDAANEEAKNEFNTRIGKANNEALNNRPIDTDDLVNRLRHEGL